MSDTSIITYSRQPEAASVKQPNNILIFHIDSYRFPVTKPDESLQKCLYKEINWICIKSNERRTERERKCENARVSFVTSASFQVTRLFFAPASLVTFHQSQRAPVCHAPLRLTYGNQPMHRGIAHNALYPGRWVVVNYKENNTVWYRPALSSKREGPFDERK